MAVREMKTLKRMENEITCAICQGHYAEPKVLPCLHYYCKRCIMKLAFTASNQPFPCPDCRKVTTLPDGGVEELKTAFFVNRYKSNYYALERLFDTVEAKCEECSDFETKGKAEAYCHQCNAFICKKCVKSHERMKSFSSHEVTSLEDLKAGRVTKIVKEPPMKKCLAHEEPLVIYCFDCNSLICRDCTVNVHREHNYEFSKIAAPEAKKSLQSKLKHLIEVSSSFSDGIKEIQGIKLEVEAQGNSVVDTFCSTFSQLQLILETHKQEMLLESSVIIQEKMNALSLQEMKLSLANAEVHSIIESINEFLGHCSDNEAMSMHADINKKIDGVIDQRKSWTSLEPVEEADIGVDVRCVEALQQLCQTKVKITQLALDPTQCTVRDEGADEAVKVNQAAGIILTAKLTNGKITRRRVAVSGQLKSLYNGSVVECEVEQSGPGEYRIQYTPTVRGRHELTVSVDGQQVAGSPFPVSVSIHPTQLGKPVSVWRSQTQVMGIAVNSAGEIIAAEFYKDLIKIDKEGKKQVLVNSSRSGLSRLFYLATDERDNIYCTCSATNKIMQCDENGRSVQVHEIQQDKGPGHAGIAVTKEELLVCELYNTGTIMVYNSNFEYARRIEHPCVGELVNLTIDIHGNIYATDCCKHMIRVFSPNGILLRSFGYTIAGIKKLNYPSDISMSGQFVYVSNYRSNDVAVFTSEGRYVTSFSPQVGEEIFDSPRSLCIDFDSFVYVVDKGTIKIF